MTTPHRQPGRRVMRRGGFTHLRVQGNEYSERVSVCVQHFTATKLRSAYEEHDRDYNIFTIDMCTLCNKNQALKIF